MKLKQTKNLSSLIKDENSIFHYTEKINRNLINKARRSMYLNNRLFIKLYNVLEDKK